ncbi:hypothetical protein [Nocardioides convexus]|nr:hypothetical protein [Nocardioides convexus]
MAETDQEQWDTAEGDLPVRVRGQARRRHGRHRGRHQPLGDLEEVSPAS